MSTISPHRRGQLESAVPVPFVGRPAVRLCVHAPGGVVVRPTLRWMRGCRAACSRMSSGLHAVPANVHADTGRIAGGCGRLPCRCRERALPLAPEMPDESGGTMHSRTAGSTGIYRQCGVHVRRPPACYRSAAPTRWDEHDVFAHPPPPQAKASHTPLPARIGIGAVIRA